MFSLFTQGGILQSHNSWFEVGETSSCAAFAGVATLELCHDEVSNVLIELKTS